MFERPDRIKDPLYVVTCVFNPRRFRTRWKLHADFEKRCLEAGAIPYTIELAFGQREFAVTLADNPCHIQLRTGHDSVGCEIWHKETLLNLAIQRLPADFKYVCVADADITWSRDDWANETLHQLQHYDVVQPFTEVNDLDDNYQCFCRHKGFAWCYSNEDLLPEDERGGKGKNCYSGAPTPPKEVSYYHPGFAMAWRREALEAVGGLVDFAILGGADTFMWWALTGRLGRRTMPRSLGPSGLKMLERWQERAERYIRRNVGYVDGLILHHWHGRRSDRKYSDRGQILLNAKFDPERDLVRDLQGLWKLSDQHTEDSIRLRDGLRKYFAGRNEDQLK